MPQRLAIVIPTYNERENIRRLLLTLLELLPQARLFVVDDNSPDGTAKAVQEIALERSQVRLIWREQKFGLASAYLDAFARILPDPSIDYIATMDADLSHNPAELLELLRHAAEHDLVVGSRYVPGGAVLNWALWRRFISQFGNTYTRRVIGAPIFDLTAGFVVYTRELLAKILPEVEEREPYAYQTEMKYLSYKAGARIKEVPIIFRERASGKSKLKNRAIFEALFFPWYLRFFKQ